MRLASILQARAIAWIESVELNPLGLTLLPLVKDLVSRYQFRKVPTKPEEFDESKGITFGMGSSGEIAIDQLAVYTYGIMLDTRVSTDKSKEVLEEILLWASKEHGLVFKPQTVKRWQYSSQLTFHSDVMPSKFPRALSDLSEKVSRAVQDVTQENLAYEPTNIWLDYDQLTRKHPLGAFTIQRRDNTPFSEGKYFSSAPLPTQTHRRLLEEFENSLT